MNFVAQVEDHLRDLGAEARKAHPGKFVIFPLFPIHNVQTSLSQLLLLR